MKILCAYSGLTDFIKEKELFCIEMEITFLRIVLAVIYLFWSTTIKYLKG